MNATIGGMGSEVSGYMLMSTVISMLASENLG
jgi:hypothetical protein